MQNLIMNSFINYPNDLEEFLAEIHISNFTNFNQKIIQALLEMKNRNQVVQLETIRLKIGDEAFESKEFSDILQADSYPNYLDLKSDFRTYLSLNYPTAKAIGLFLAS
ncbi:hypothetical protein BGL55_00440 [Helicobacter pylori]|nr:hypothetical protein [Helicobacter pylori]OPG32258.1 hypothetical protein BGL55_00440 [Helicobacter pylori]